MIDLALLRDNPDLVKRSQEARGESPDTVDDALAAERVFEMLMGNDVAPRKEFIIEGAYQLDSERIDA